MAPDQTGGATTWPALLSAIALGFWVAMPARADDARRTAPDAMVERAVPGAGLDETGFSISIEGETIAGATATAGLSRAPDPVIPALALAVRYDGLGAERRLAVATEGGRAAYGAGEVVRFETAANYPAFIERAEIVVMDRAASARPVLARIAVAPNGSARWTMPADGSGTYGYALRVFDARGRWDETHLQSFYRSASVPGDAPIARSDPPPAAPRRRGIPSKGGIVTVSGTGAVPGGTVTAMGEAVEVDADGAFAVERILPPGDHVVVVETDGRRLARHVTVPAREWFGTGIVDLTLGREERGPRDGSDGFVDGRVAYYVTGHIAGSWTITSSADSQDGPVEDIFERLDDKDPDRVLDRLRAESGLQHPTHGDGGTSVDDTPTQGNVYLRVENDRTRLTFGSFAAGVTGPGLLQNTRDLYGFEARHVSPGVTSAGEARVAVTGYVAQPDTLPQRDILRGTGGSIYFLSRQDVVFDSVKATVQVRDRETGSVVDTVVLKEGVDFTVDHIQGVIVLSGPLPSAASDASLIDEAGADLVNALIVQYEYTPDGLEMDDTAWGGRAEFWATDRLRFALTAMEENTEAGEDQRMRGADLFLRLGETGFATLEVARTEGPGIDRALSTDGGLTISSSGASPGDGRALRFDSRVELNDLGIARDGFLTLRAERLEEGFSTLAEDIAADRDVIKLDGEIAVTDRLSVSAAFERFGVEGGESRDAAELAFRYALNDRLSLRTGLAHLDEREPGSPAETGLRTDAALRLTYAASDDLSLRAFGQGTIARSGGLDENDRLGAGIEARFGRHWTLEAEASGGDGGTRGQARLAYAPSAETEVHLGYTLDPTRTARGGLNDDGTIVLGGRSRVSPAVTSWNESVLDLPGGKRSLTRAYGLDWTPAPGWTFAGSIEVGKVEDADAGDFDRDAISGGVVWSPDADLTARARLEYRDEDGAGPVRDRRTWGLTAGYANQITAEWRLLVDVEALTSEAAATDIRDGEYVRASVGYAYRPVLDERLNLVFGYSHLRDLPGVDRKTAAGGTEGPEQISDVLSLNASFDLDARFTLGGKLGYRRSEIADRGTDAFDRDRAALAALRLDWHVLRRWDAMVEGRVLRGLDVGSIETGALLGAYRHVSDSVRVGLIHEWGGVSDDLTDIDYDDRGLMLNVVKTF
jgi:hypothetical protein